MSRWQLRFRWVLLVTLLTSVMLPAAAEPLLSTAGAAKFEPTFLQQVLAASPTDTFRILVTARGKADLTRLPSAYTETDQRAPVQIGGKPPW